MIGPKVAWSEKISGKLKYPKTKDMKVPLYMFLVKRVKCIQGGKKPIPGGSRFYKTFFNS